MKTKIKHRLIETFKSRAKLMDAFLDMSDEELGDGAYIFDSKETAIKFLETSELGMRVFWWSENGFEGDEFFFLKECYFDDETS